MELHRTALYLATLAAQLIANEVTIDDLKIQFDPRVRMGQGKRLHILERAQAHCAIHAIRSYEKRKTDSVRLAESMMRRVETGTMSQNTLKELICLCVTSIDGVTMNLCYFGCVILKQRCVPETLRPLFRHSGTGLETAPLKPSVSNFVISFFQWIFEEIELDEIEAHSMLAGLQSQIDRNQLTWKRLKRLTRDGIVVPTTQRSPLT